MKSHPVPIRFFIDQFKCWISLQNRVSLRFEKPRQKKMVGRILRDRVCMIDQLAGEHVGDDELEFFGDDLDRALDQLDAICDMVDLDVVMSVRLRIGIDLYAQRTVAQQGGGDAEDCGAASDVEDSGRFRE